MRIGIDVSQVIYSGTGVATYVRKMVLELVGRDSANRYVLFGSSLRQREALESFGREVKSINPTVEFVILPLPPSALHILWNVLHIVPVEWFIGSVDVFWSSDWTTPPLARAGGVTTIHDLIVYRYPEHFDPQIVKVQKKRLSRAAKEYDSFFCDSEATMRDAKTYLSLESEKLHIVYPGFVPIYYGHRN